jgi:hypothetical protein
LVESTLRDLVESTLRVLIKEVRKRNLVLKTITNIIIIEELSTKFNTNSILLTHDIFILLISQVRVSKKYWEQSIKKKTYT